MEVVIGMHVAHEEGHMYDIIALVLALLSIFEDYSWRMHMMLK
jgi:hypothetical protein